MSALLIESLLGVGLVALALRLLWGRDRFETIVFFITFGMLLTMMWSWLGSGDVALAEAAIGAGLSGALLLGAWARTGDGPGDAAPQSSRLPWPALSMAGAGAAIGLFFEHAHNGRLGATSTLPQRVAEALPQSGVESPVTAVLLNFRGYDTLLEVAVLVAAWLAAAGPDHRVHEVEDEPETDRLAGGAAIALGRIWLPLVLLVSTYLAWAGSHWAGGAFQAAALLAGTAILIRLVGVPIRPIWPAALSSGLPIAGLALFSLAAAAGLVLQGRLLAYSPGWAGTWIFSIELTMTVSLAAVLMLLYLAVQRKRGAP